MWRSVWVLGAAFSVAACTMKPPTEAMVRDDQFRPYREVETAPFRFPVQPGSVTMRLVAHIDRKTGGLAAMVKIHHHYLGQHRHNYETARNNRAEQLKLTVVARYGNCQVRTNCPLDELYIVDIPEAELRAAGKAGYPFKVFPRVGADIILTVPTEMITSLFALIDQERSRGPKSENTASANTASANTLAPRDLTKPSKP